MENNNIDQIIAERNDRDLDNLVVVLSRNYSTGLSVVRSLGSAGYTVDLVASAFRRNWSELVACSKYVRDSVEVVSKKVKDGDDLKLLDALLAYAGRYDHKPVLFPTDDYTTSIMDLNKSLLEDIFIMPEIIGGGDGSMTRSMDKRVQSDLAKKAGLLIPKEWVFSLEEEIVIPDDMVYPCFCKPIESITGYKHEMKMCEDKDDLLSHLHRLRRIFDKRSILVQEFLEIDSEIDLSGVCFDQEVIIPAVIRKTQVAQYEKGVTLAGQVVDNSYISDIWDAVIKMMKSFHYFGMFDMEFNVVGDKLYFNEVNLRSGGPNYSYFKSGVNLPALFVKEAKGQGHSPEDGQVKELNKHFIYEKVAWDDYLHEMITKKELNDLIDKADIHLLFDDDDPAPGEYFKAKTRRRKLSRKKKKVKKLIKRTLFPPLRKIKHVLAGYPQAFKKNARDPESKDPRILVSGRNYSTNLTIAKSLGEAGYEVEVLRIFQVRPKKKNIMKRLKPDAYSKYIKAYYVCVSKRRTRRIVKRLIRLADPDRKMLLIPADDLIANIADDYMDELRDYYYLPNINDTPREINRIMSKEVQKELARQAGLPVVNSCLIKTRRKEEPEIPSTISYPCFIKPNISRFSSKSRMKKCESEEELRETLTDYSRKKGVEMLVEDFVEIDKEYSLLGLSTREGVVAPGFFVATNGGQQEHRGVAITGQLLPCRDWQPLVSNLKKFVESLNFEGLFDIDLIETKDGKMYFIEINMRFGASGYAVTKCGVNLPAMYADYVLHGKPIDLNCSIDDKCCTFISEKVMIEEYVKSRITRADMKRMMNEVDVHFVKDADDPKGWRHFSKFYTLISPVMRIAQRYWDKKKEERDRLRELRRLEEMKAEEEALAAEAAAMAAAGVSEEPAEEAVTGETEAQKSAAAEETADDAAETAAEESIAPDESYADDEADLDDDTDTVDISDVDDDLDKDIDKDDPDDLKEDIKDDLDDDDDVDEDV